MKKLYFLLVSLMIAGCSYTPRYTFREVGTQSNDPESYGSVSETKPLKFKVTFTGVKKSEDEQITAVSFDMNLTNTGSEPVVLKPTDYNLIDDDANHFRPTVSGTNAKTVTLYPQSTVGLSLSFNLPPGYDVAKVGSLRIVWNYKVGNTTHRRLTKFLKKEVEYYYRDYHYPHYGFGYSPWRFSLGVGFHGHYRHRHRGCH